MYIIPTNFCKNQYPISHNLNANTSSNIFTTHNIGISNANSENYKANYLVSFKGNMSCVNSSESGIGTLNHQSAFFREPITDEIVQNYILNNFSTADEINIVSGACSSGEEAKSYAMMLDSLNGKLNITGFDISPKVVEKAQDNNCQLLKDDNSLVSHLSLDSENILLTDNIDNLTEYEKKCRNKFNQYYQAKGSPERIPIFPNAQQELSKLEELLTNKVEFEKQKKLYNEQIQKTVNLSPELAKYMPNITFEDSIEMSKQALSQQAKAYRTVANYQSVNHSFDNCNFTVGDVRNLEKLYEPNSKHVLLYRNALYHTLCTGNNLYRVMKDDAIETMDSIAKQMNKILKTKGLVVYGENECMQGIDNEVIKNAMENNGFKLLNKNLNNVWVKTKMLKSIV